MHLAAAATTASSPSPMWYATRGLGTATLVVLTVTVALGIATAVPREDRATPRFVVAGLHRNLGLFAVVLLVAHVVTTILDPFAHIGVLDSTVPFTAAYRPRWLGLGVVAAEVLVAVAATSVLRARIGAQTWRVVHWTAYASWPLAVVHGLGTGTDAPDPWMIGLVASCVSAVLLVLVERLRTGRLRTLPLRAAAAVAVGASVLATVSWAVRGPFRPGWAVAAGTPVSATAPAPTPRPGPVHIGQAAFRDDLVGTMVRDSAGRTQVALRDVADPTLTLAIRPAAGGESLPVVTVSRNGRPVCTAAARASATLYAVCGPARFTIALSGGLGSVTGVLSSSGPLG